KQSFCCDQARSLLDAIQQRAEAWADLDVEWSKRAPDVRAVGADHWLSDFLLQLIDDAHGRHGTRLDVNAVNFRMFFTGLQSVGIDLRWCQAEFLVGAELASADPFDSGDFDALRV